MVVRLEMHFQIPNTFPDIEVRFKFLNYPIQNIFLDLKIYSNSKIYSLRYIFIT